jgi:hypothetical protein
MERLLVVFLVCCTALLSVAQDSALDRSKLPQGSRIVRARMLKEKVPVDPTWLDTLVVKAAHAKPVIALRHLESAVVIADSLKDRSRERDLLFKLAAAQERVGKPKDALASLGAAHFLKDSLAAAALQRSSSLTAQQIAEAHDELQRLQTEHGAAMKSLHGQHEKARERSRMLLMAAGGVILMMLLVLVWSLMQNARLRRASKERASVELPITPPVQEPPRQNALRHVVPAAGPIVEVPVAPADPEADMLLALFHKRMPERLQALTDARDRGDHEKVGRVLASMRPQLAQHDGLLFNERCARLIAAREHVLSSEYAGHLHQLVADVEQVLRETRG